MACDWGGGGWEAVMGGGGGGGGGWGGGNGRIFRTLASVRYTQWVRVCINTVYM